MGTCCNNVCNRLGCTNETCCNVCNTASDYYDHAQALFVTCPYALYSVMFFAGLAFLFFVLWRSAARRIAKWVMPCVTEIKPANISYYDTLNRLITGHSAHLSAILIGHDKQLMGVHAQAEKQTTAILKGHANQLARILDAHADELANLRDMSTTALQALKSVVEQLTTDEEDED